MFSVFSLVVKGLIVYENAVTNLKTVLELTSFKKILTFQFFFCCKDLFTVLLKLIILFSQLQSFKRTCIVTNKIRCWHVPYFVIMHHKSIHRQVYFLCIWVALLWSCFMCEHQERLKGQSHEPSNVWPSASCFFLSTPIICSSTLVFVLFFFFYFQVLIKGLWLYH